MSEALLKHKKLITKKLDISWRRKMLKRIFLLGIILLAVNMQMFSVYSWDNGGYSNNPANPNYGTHDWIAQHALDWLPSEEKQFILDNIANYLYGTELPDNSTAPDGIGDKTEHHVYYFANESLQDNASASRAQEEYLNALNRFKAGDFLNATKRLGIMTHYVCDLASFGHVMGNKTFWGNATHHDNYEDYVNTRTNSYLDEFNTFLVFDDALTNISAYNASITLAYDTTFDVDGDLTCVWMEQNYNWNNPTFKNRCGESLNLAVNLLADVLHTFYLEVEASTHFIDVPFHYQDVEYYCGPACLEMIFDYYGEDINQSEIADVARTIGEPAYSTFTDELRRAAHFSNISTSMGAEIPEENIRGYALRKYGYASFETVGMNLSQLKNLIDHDNPLVILTWYSEFHVSTHYRVVTGYNETHVFLHDPWNKPEWGGTYGGANICFTHAEFLDLWSLSGNWALYVSPWVINVSAPSYFKAGTPFQINVTITYPQLIPEAITDYSASSCNITIMLPNNLSLAEGESQQKTLGTGFLDAGMNSTASWMLTAISSEVFMIGIEAEGLISGSVDAHITYPAYIYDDRIGAATNFTIELAEDKNAPLIGIPSRVPQNVVEPHQDVEVSVNVTDAESGVKNVTLFYTVNNGTTWENRTMNYNASASLYETTIGGQPLGTLVRFMIVTYDYAGNNATLDGTEPCCAYQVIPEFPSMIILPLFMIATLIAVMASKRKHFTEPKKKITKK